LPALLEACIWLDYAYGMCLVAKTPARSNPMSDNCPILITATGQNFSAFLATYTDKKGRVCILSKQGSSAVVGSLAWLKENGGRTGGRVAKGEIIYVDLTAADGSVVKEVPLDVWNCKPGTRNKTIVPNAAHPVGEFTPEEQTTLANISLGSLSYGDHDTVGHAARAVWAIQHADGRLLYETISRTSVAEYATTGPLFLKNLAHIALHDPSALADIFEKHEALAYLVLENIDSYIDLVDIDPAALEALREAASKYSGNLRALATELGVEKVGEVARILGRYGLGLSAMRSFAKLGEVRGPLWGGTKEFEAYCRSGAREDSWTALAESDLSGETVELYGRLQRLAGLGVEQETEVLVPRVLEMSIGLAQSGLDRQEVLLYLDAGAETVAEVAEAKRRELSVEDISLYAAAGLTSALVDISEKHEAAGENNPWWVIFHNAGIGPRMASVYRSAEGPGGKRFTCGEVLRLHNSKVSADEAIQWLRSGYSSSIETIIDLHSTGVSPREAKGLEIATQRRLGKPDVSSKEMCFEYMRQYEEGPSARALGSYTRFYIPASKALEYATLGVEPEAANEDYSRLTGTTLAERSRSEGEWASKLHAEDLGRGVAERSGEGNSRPAAVLEDDEGEIEIPTRELSTGRAGEPTAEINELNIDQLRIHYAPFGVERHETIVQLRDLRITDSVIRTWRKEAPDLPIGQIIAFQQQGEIDAFEYMVLSRILKWANLVPSDATWEHLSRAVVECRKAGIDSVRLQDLIEEVHPGNPRDTGIRVRNLQELLWLGRNVEDLPEMASHLKKKGYKLTVVGVREYLEDSRSGGGPI